MSYGAEEYRDGVQFVYNLISSNDMALQTDDRRIEVIVAYS